MTQRDPAVPLRQMLEYAQTARRIGTTRSNQQILDDEVAWHALLRVLEVIGEAASRLQPEERPADVDIPWTQIIGARNFLAHGYDRLDPDVVLRTLRDDINPLIESLETALARIDSERRRDA